MVSRASLLPIGLAMLRGAPARADDAKPSGENFAFLVGCRKYSPGQLQSLKLLAKNSMNGDSIPALAPCGNAILHGAFVRPSTRSWGFGCKIHFL